MGDGGEGVRRQDRLTMAGAAGGASAARPNILWYCSDQQRYDTIRALGQPHIATPRLDALCADGVAFRRAYTQSPICTPARATFLTGRYPAAHQTHRNGNAYFPPHEKLVTKMFAEAGYDCGLVGKLHLSAAKTFEVRPDDGYRAFWWSHHPTPDAARGHDYETWLRHEKKVDPVELYAPINYFCGPGVPADAAPDDVVQRDGDPLRHRAARRSVAAVGQPLRSARAVRRAAGVPRTRPRGGPAAAAVPRVRSRAAAGVRADRPADQGRGRSAHPQVDPAGRGRRSRRDRVASWRLRRAGGEGELLRDDHADRRPVRQDRRRAARHGAARQHDHRLHERSRRAARRPRADPQGLPLLRRAGARAADPVVARALRTRSSRATRWSRRSTSRRRCSRPRGFRCPTRCRDARCCRS